MIYNGCVKQDYRVFPKLWLSDSQTLKHFQLSTFLQLSHVTVLFKVLVFDYRKLLNIFF